MPLVSARLALLPTHRPFRREGAHVQTLAEQVDALEERKALHQPANPVVHREPGFLSRGMTVAPPPAAYRLLEGWGKAAVAPTSGSCIGGHPRILFRALRAASGRLPELWPGGAENPVGRWTVQMVAGTNGGAPVNRT